MSVLKQWPDESIKMFMFAMDDYGDQDQDTINESSESEDDSHYV